jgi:hypothetical protein
MLLSPTRAFDWNTLEVVITNLILFYPMELYLKLKDTLHQAIEPNISWLNNVILMLILGLYFRTHTTHLAKNQKQHTQNGVTLMDFPGVTERYHTHG